MWCGVTATSLKLIIFQLQHTLIPQQLTRANSYTFYPFIVTFIARIFQFFCSFYFWNSGGNDKKLKQNGLIRVILNFTSHFTCIKLTKMLNWGGD